MLSDDKIKDVSKDSMEQQCKFVESISKVKICKDILVII